MSREMGGSFSLSARPLQNGPVRGRYFGFLPAMQKL
jgi:hypothetical protein